MKKSITTTEQPGTTTQHYPASMEEVILIYWGILLLGGLKNMKDIGDPWPSSKGVDLTI